MPGTSLKNPHRHPPKIPRPPITQRNSSNFSLAPFFLNGGSTTGPQYKAFLMAAFLYFLRIARAFSRERFPLVSYVIYDTVHYRFRVLFSRSSNTWVRARDVARPSYLFPLGAFLFRSGIHSKPLIQLPTAFWYRECFIKNERSNLKWLGKISFLSASSASPECPCRT